MFILSCSTIFFQSCQTESINTIDTKELALEHFGNLLTERNLKLQEIVNKSRELTLNSSKYQNFSRKEIQGLENKSKEAITPLIPISKQLLSFYGVTKDTLIKKFGSLDDLRIVLVGMLVYEIEKEVQNQESEQGINSTNKKSSNELNSKSSSLVIGYSESNCQGIVLGQFSSGEDACAEGATSYEDILKGTCHECGDTSWWNDPNAFATIWVIALAEPTPIGEGVALALTGIVGTYYVLTRLDCIEAYTDCKMYTSNFPCDNCFRFCIVQGY